MSHGTRTIRALVLAPVGLALAPVGLALAVPPAAVAPPPAVVESSVFTSLSHVHACALTDEGVFAATEGGLVLSDWSGQVKHVWTALDGLGGTRVHTLLQLGDELLIGTESGVTLARVASGRIMIGKTLSSNAVRDFAVLDGHVYVATWGQGLLRLSDDRKRLSSVRFAGRKHSGRARSRKRMRMTAVVTHDGAIVAATFGAGIYRLVDNRLRLIGELGAAQKMARLVWALASRDGVLYAGTATGLVKISSERIVTVADGDIRVLIVTDADTAAEAATRATGSALWAGTFGDGGFRYRGRLVRAGLPSAARFVQGMSRAKQRGCLATMSGLWLKRSARSRWVHAPLDMGPGSNDISAMALDGARLWVGTFNHGLAMFDGKRWHRVRHRLIDLKINALALSGDTLWIATAAGLTTIRGGRKEEVSRLGSRDGLPSRYVLSLSPLTDGRMLVGTTQGAAIVSPALSSPTVVVALGRKQGARVGNVWAVASDDDGYLWLGTTKGLYRGTLDGPWSRYSLSSKDLRDDWVMAIVVSEHSAWVGTYKGGVVRFDWQSSKPEVLTSRPFGDGWVNPGGLTLDGQTLYASTMDGLRRSSLAVASWQRGIAGPGKDTTSMVSAGPWLWVATRRGLVRHAR